MTRFECWLAHCTYTGQVLVEILKLSDLLEITQTVATTLAGWHFGIAEKRKERQVDLLASLGQLSTQCAALDLGMSRLALDRAIGRLMASSDNQASSTAIPAVFNALASVRDETSLRLFLYLPERSKELYLNSKPFGEVVWRAFPGANYDIEEAAKCFCLTRSTAAVFHCMRAVEVGIHALLESIGLSKAEIESYTSWKRYVDRLHAEAKKKDTEISIAWRGRQRRLVEIASHLDGLREATRNPTMHVQSIYTLEQSHDVFSATSGLMRRIAEALRPELMSD